MDARGWYQLGEAEAAAGRHDQAVAAYQKAAADGLADAMCALGVCYHDGNGVPRDLLVALGHFRAAAARGSAAAACMVGLMLETGTGVPSDPNEALLWYRRAAAGGHPVANELRQRILDRVGR